MKVTAIFDIGKTNKKFFLFDEHYQEVYKEYERIVEIEDEDGYPCDNLVAIQQWLARVFQKTLRDDRFEIQALNFSTYGASFVHVDKNGQPVTPLYNYLKPYPEDLLASFYKKYGDELRFAQETASPPLGMLNSGLQLYWLKYAKPKFFQKIRWSLHLPQYFSFLFTGIPLSEYTSIGCHTGLWDFSNYDYHQWVYAEGIDRILPPIVDTYTSINARYEEKKIKTGIGIHDSSSALLPYLRAERKPFSLLSTGTWSIALNPFSEEILTQEDLKNDCLNFMRIDGHAVKVARLFLGNEYKIWTRTLAAHFKQPIDKHKKVKPDHSILQALQRFQGPVYQWESIRNLAKQDGMTELSLFSSYEEAYHKLILDLVDLQVDALHLAVGKTAIQKIFVDGGFIDNKLFIQLLSQKLPDFEVTPTSVPLGSALGAALVVHDEAII